MFKDLKYFIYGSGVMITVLLCIMAFSPLSLQFSENAVSCSSFEEDNLNRLMSAEAALNIVEKEIAEKSENLPRIAYFDRFLSSDKRYDVQMARTDIYMLQWKRIKLLELMNDTVALREALEDYSKVIGYNQETAKTMLDRLKAD